MQELSTIELKQAIANKDLIIDCRPTPIFINGYLQSAISIELNNNFEARAAFFSKEIDSLILIAQEDDKENIMALSNDIKSKIKGIHYGNFNEWLENNIATDLIITVDVQELKLDIAHDDKAFVIDVRARIHYDQEHIVGASNMPISDFNDPAKIGLLEEKHNLYIHGNEDNDGVLVSSILKKNGFHNIRTIEGGIKAIIADGSIPLHTQNKKSQN